MGSFLNSILSIFRGGNIAQQLQDVGIRTTQGAGSIQLQNRAGQQIALNETSVIIQDTNGNIITLDATGIHIQVQRIKSQRIVGQHAAGELFDDDLCGRHSSSTLLCGIFCVVD